MDKQRLTFNIPRQSLISIGLCLVGILIFLMAGFLPASRTMAELEVKKATAQYKIEEQKTLTPLFQAFREIEGRKASEILPMLAKTKLPRTQIDTLSLQLNTAAQVSGMSLISANPNLKEMTSGAQFLPVSVVLRGDFAQFRKLLINLGGLSYVEHIEEISIRMKPDAREYKLTIWIAVG